MSFEPIGVAVILENSEGQILLGKRKNSYKAGLYGLPGGRLEKTESLDACAKRELFEETGLRVDAVKYLGVVREYQEGYSFVHFIFLSSGNIGKPEVTEPEKCEGWEWFHPHQIPKEILPGHRAGIRLLTHPEETNLQDSIDLQ
ncbi:MAG: NUDIX domain-containing protein [bacterium]|nr:NUDIX domain-containing protein [bacterium]